MASAGGLRLLIEAESLVNDGVAAVLFTLILAWAAHDPSAAEPARSASWRRSSTIAGGGVLVGLLVGLGAVFLGGRRTITWSRRR